MRRKKFTGKPVTIRVERLSDHSRMIFTISSNATIEKLRNLLNRHLPPKIKDKFILYSYQRGARIQFHPPSLKLDYFPVIFDQSTLDLIMDDQNLNEQVLSNDKIKIDPMETRRKTGYYQESNPFHIDCVSIFKSLMFSSTYEKKLSTCSKTDILTY